MVALMREKYQLQRLLYAGRNSNKNPGIAAGVLHSLRIA